MIKRRIYISPAANKNLDQNQLAIKGAILRAIEEEDFEPQEFAPYAWSFNRANQEISRCQEAVILAFARWPIIPSNHQDELFSMTSEHNHFDGALAFSHNIPLLVVANENVR